MEPLRKYLGCENTSAVSIVMEKKQTRMAVRHIQSGIDTCGGHTKKHMNYHHNHSQQKSGRLHVRPPLFPPFLSPLSVSPSLLTSSIQLRRHVVKIRENVESIIFGSRTTHSVRGGIFAVLCGENRVASASPSAGALLAEKEEYRRRRRRKRFTTMKLATEERRTTACCYIFQL